MSPFIEDPPNWFNALLPFPDEWGWRVGRMLPQEPGGIYQVLLSRKESLRSFNHECMRTEHVRWFFDRGVYAIAQPRKINAGTERTVYGLALYPLKQVGEIPKYVYHVTLREKVERIRNEGVLTGRRAGECTSTWKEAIDFVHVWSTPEQAGAWQSNRKLKTVSLGPWSVVVVAPESPLYEDPKSDGGGWIFECDYCVPKHRIVGITHLSPAGD